MTPFIHTLVYSAVGIFLYMNIWFVMSLIKKRNDIADIAWGLGFIFVTGLSLCSNRIFSVRQIIISTVVIIWGLRLMAHIYLRNRNKKEDFRYKKWRDEWGKNFLVRSYLQVFLFQGFFMFLISLPILAVNSSTPLGLNPINMLGIVIWAIGFFFETVGDYQLSQFLGKEENKGRIMTQGLWAYTRHPNYFGEVTLWWGVFLAAIEPTTPILTILSPLTISFLILYVSGIPMLEKQYEGNQEFEEYRKRTSSFIPLPPTKL